MQNDQVAASSLFQDNQARLCLRFLGRKSQLHRMIRSADLRCAIWEPDDDLPGGVYVRLMDRDQWDKFTDSEQIAWCDRVVSTNAFAVIFADALEPEEGLTARFIETGVPLFSSSLPAERVFDELMYYKRALLGESETLHGVFLEIFGVGVLLQGESGVGKSELGLSLVSRGHRLIADDAPEIWRTGDILTGACPAALQDFVELRGLGFLDVRSLYGEAAIRSRKSLELILRLEFTTPEELRKFTPDISSKHSRTILGIQVPLFTLPVMAGRPLEILVESAVRMHIQLQRGYDGNRAFVRRQKEMIVGTRDITRK